MVMIIITPAVNMRMCFNVVSRLHEEPVRAFSVYVITLHFLTIPRADTEQVSVAEWVRDTDTLQQITSTFFNSLRSHRQKNANHLKQHSFFLHHN
jgi:hypothetical protein